MNNFLLCANFFVMGNFWLKTVQLYIIISDVVTIQEPSTSTAQLYDFMLSHANIHNMSSLKMNVVSEEDLVIILKLFY